MPKFSQASFSKLSTCHIDLQTLFYEVIKHFDCAILDGYRNEEDQNAAANAGNTKLRWPNSKHNSSPSLAVDVSPFPIDWHNIQRFYWFGGYVLGIAQRLKDEGKMSHAIRWGGDWNGNFNDLDEKGLRDFVHFELII